MLDHEKRIIENESTNRVCLQLFLRWVEHRTQQYLIVVGILDVCPTGRDSLTSHNTRRPVAHKGSKMGNIPKK